MSELHDLEAGNRSRIDGTAATPGRIPKIEIERLTLSVTMQKKPLMNAKKR